MSDDDAPAGHDVPSWVQDAVFYQIFPDRFARSDRVAKPSNLEAWDAEPTRHGYKGGDLRGISERLEHLERLGVTAIYLNPVFQSASNHRYHTHDYFRVDPMLGGDDALRELLDAAHERGMRVILDGVFNHASRGFFPFSDLLENGEKSAYRDWFRVHAFPLNAYGEGEIGYDAWAGLPALPEFDTDTQAVREFLWGVATHWLEFGIDGWRLDVPNEIDDDAFWREFRRRCREVDPECYLVGEIWGDASRWVQGDQFDAVMNYPLARRIFGFVAADLNTREMAQSGYEQIERRNAEATGEALAAELTRYAPAVVSAQLNLLGSHDTPRIRTLLCEDDRAVRLAYAMVMTLPGAPCIYYGDEIGLTGGHDPGCRGAMPWGDDGAWDRALYDELAALAALRHEHEALRRGAFEVAFAEDDVLAYRRGTSDGLLTVVNAGDAPHAEAWTLRPPLEAGTWHAVHGAGAFEVEGNELSWLEVDGRRGVAGRTAAIFRRG